jgi:hypothetical protein
VCHLCDTKKVEDENYFLLDCPAYILDLIFKIFATLPIRLDLGGGGSLVPQTRGSHTPNWCVGLAVTLKIDYCYYYYCSNYIKKTIVQISSSRNANLLNPSKTLELLLQYNNIWQKKKNQISPYHYFEVGA